MQDDRDLALVGQDPAFGGGYASQAAAFWHGAQRLGRVPALHYLSRTRTLSLVRRSLAWRALHEERPPFSGTAVPSFLPELDAVNQLAGGRRIAAGLRRYRSIWVVATSAPYGYAALASRRPYACWVGTGLESEWQARRPHLAGSRRAALALNAPLLRLLERRVLQGARLVYATSPASRRTIAAAARLRPEQVRILPIPVDPDVFAPEDEDDWRARLERPTLVFLGRATDPRKNLPLLLDALPAIRARVPEARLLLVGAPPPGRLPAGVDALGPVDSVAEPLRRGTLLVLPSLQEGFGIVVAEALASGVPALVTPCGGPEELVRASGGGQVLESFDAEELAGAAVALLSEPERLLSMRSAGRAYVEREHSPGGFATMLAAALDELDRTSSRSTAPADTRPASE